MPRILKFSLFLPIVGTMAVIFWVYAQILRKQVQLKRGFCFILIAAVVGFLSIFFSTYFVAKISVVVTMSAGIRLLCAFILGGYIMNICTLLNLKSIHYPNASQNSNTDNESCPSNEPVKEVSKKQKLLYVWAIFPFLGSMILLGWDYFTRLSKGEDVTKTANHTTKRGFVSVILLLIFLLPAMLLAPKQQIMNEILLILLGLILGGFLMNAYIFYIIPKDLKKLEESKR